VPVDRAGVDLPPDHPAAAHGEIGLPDLGEGYSSSDGALGWRRFYDQDPASFHNHLFTEHGASPIYF
jgi:hypothetical protein